MQRGCFLAGETQPETNSDSDPAAKPEAQSQPEADEPASSLLLSIPVTLRGKAMQLEYHKGQSALAAAKTFCETLPTEVLDVSALPAATAAVYQQRLADLVVSKLKDAGIEPAPEAAENTPSNAARQESGEGGQGGLPRSPSMADRLQQLSTSDTAIEDAVEAASAVEGAYAVQQAHGDQEPKQPEWTAHDDGDGNMYYYNNVTGVSQWEPPPELAHTQGPPQQEGSASDVSEYNDDSDYGDAASDYGDAKPVTQVWEI